MPFIAASKKNSIKRGPFGSVIKKAYFVSSGYKIYQQKNAIYNDFSLGNYYIDENKFNELKDFEVKAGDLVISCSGTIGKIAVVPNNAEKGIINQALLKITLDKDVVSIEYFVNLFSSYIFQAEILSKTRRSAMLNISSVKALKEILFPIPSLKEQERIVERIKELFTRADTIEKSVKIAQTHCNKLSQSILSKAFRGELVEQDQKDEPAEVLLKK